MKQSTIKKLDTKLSLFVRTKDGEYCSCVTCGVVKHFTEMDAGHFITRSHFGTRWDERNVHPQCKECNQLGSGMRKEYRKFLVNEYGEWIIDELKRKAGAHTKYTESDAEEMLKVWRKNGKEK